MHPSWNDYPHLFAELDPEGNKGLTYFGKPVSVLELAAGTGNHLDWICSTCEHKWKAKGNNRSFGGGCPACSNQAIHSDGRNSMAQTHPELASEYQGDAQKIVAGTNQKLDWKCSTCDHEWKAIGFNRVHNGNGCPVCSNKAIHSDGRNSMAITHPELALEYQGDATQIIAGTNKRLDWKCSTCDHEWKARGQSRKNGIGCPACATTGFQPDQLGYYYVHKILNESGEIIMYKGGISGNWKKRLRELRSGLPVHLTIENCEVIPFEVGQEAQDLETTLLRMAAEEGWKAPPRKFDGGTELFLENPLDHARKQGLIG
jgi:Zn finger protein HypA/HybF involved in hydrogenase expression